MRYMLFVKMQEDVGDAPEALFAAVNAEMQELFASGAMVDAGGLAPSPQSTQVELRGGDVITTNGPWAEAKEVAGGYSILEARTHEEAVEAARRLVEIHKEHWPGWEGAVEVRPIRGA
jgi:hypothetical protein